MPPSAAYFSHKVCDGCATPALAVEIAHGFGEMRKTFILIIGLLVSAMLATAAQFGTVRGLVHDPQHRPVANAEVVLKAARSEWKQMVQTGATGEYRFENVPVGDYALYITVPGFAPETRDISILS